MAAPKEVRVVSAPVVAERNWRVGILLRPRWQVTAAAVSAARTKEELERATASRNSVMSVAKRKPRAQQLLGMIGDVSSIVASATILQP
jgi:hypothetical protein